jgi:hypothetical protein
MDQSMTSSFATGVLKVCLSKAYKVQEVACSFRSRMDQTWAGGVGHSWSETVVHVKLIGRIVGQRQ